ncbi:MAG: hypothetical protein RL757_1813 [Bacteroidota bacterium]|jgi:uncharacterized protein (TIGR00255 family)
MLFSMTGFGRATRTFGDKNISIEIRALNSKMTDIRFRMPSHYKEKELELRKLLSDAAERGKIDMVISVRPLAGEEPTNAINRELFKQYYRELTEITTELKISKTNLLSAILQLPSVVSSEEATISEEEWQAVLETIQVALVNFQAFRAQEGAALETELRDRIKIIADLHLQTVPHEAARFERVRAKLRQNLDDFLGRDNIDENRFEQEVLFYLEKLDITEEKVRLEQHCKYFLEQLNDKNTSAKGRTLNFITQEIGREINTMGSKAYSADIQHLVVKMKDELEKIKEQIANLV